MANRLLAVLGSLLALAPAGCGYFDRSPAKSDDPRDWVVETPDGAHVIDTSLVPDRIKVATGPTTVGWISSQIAVSKTAADHDAVYDVYDAPVGGSAIGTYSNTDGFVPEGAEPGGHRTTDTTATDPAE